MAIKKGMFQDYVKKQNQERERRHIKAQNSKYSHNKVYETDDKPVVAEEVKAKTTVKKEAVLNKPIEKAKAKAKPKTIPKAEQKVTKKVEPKLITPKINISIGLASKNVMTLTGIQQDLFFKLLKIAHDNGSNNIEKITNHQLQELTGTSHGNIKLAITRLVKKGILERYKGKTSKFGYYNLGFKDDIFAFSVKLAKDMGLFSNREEKLTEEA